MKFNYNWQLIDINKATHKRIMEWDDFDFVNWDIKFNEDKIVLQQKENECKAKILANYTDTDQRNNLMRWTQDEIDTMINFIKAMVLEFRTNWKDADLFDVSNIA